MKRLFELKHSEDDIERFYKILFNEGETKCFGLSTYDILVSKADYKPNENDRFFVINPIKDYRRDNNVTAFRNILVEFDKGSIEEQMQIIINSELPYSTLVFSGGKSLHAIISLEWPMTDKESYKALVKRVYDRLGGKSVVDTATSNPSRFSRAPGAVRDNTKVQELIEAHGRVPLAELLQWLGPAPIPKPKEPVFVSKRKLLPTRAHAFLTYGKDDAENGRWNSRLFETACDMFRAGYTLEEAEDKLSEVTGHLDSKDKSTIRSAKRTVKLD